MSISTVKLPKPNGHSNVGMMRIDIVDESRKQLFDFEKKNAYRKLPIMIYYPTDDIVGLERAKYISEEESIIMNKYFELLFPLNSYTIETHLYKDAKLTSKNDKYNVILFNQGYMAYIQAYTVLLSDLASMGYIVVSIGHPYESGVIKYLDGSVIEIHKDNLSLLTSLKEETEEYNELIKKEVTSDNDILNIEKKFRSMYKQEFHDHVSIWEQDTRFVLEYLQKCNSGEIDSVLKNKLQISSGVGVFGHSYGGATAAQVCWKNDLVKCGINLDGGAFGSYSFKDIKKPFLTILNPRNKKITKSVYIKSTKEAYRLIVDGIGHFGYSDFLYLTDTALLEKYIASRDIDESRNLLTTYISTFFEKHLRNNIDVSFNATAYPGVTFLYKNC